MWILMMITVLAGVTPNGTNQVVRSFNTSDECQTAKYALDKGITLPNTSVQFVCQRKP